MSSVLVVDDEKNILKTLSIGLKRYQYDVQEALSGYEALDIMQKSPCDFVVSDVRMAPMDGYTLVSKLHKQYPEVNVILISAYDFDDDKFHRKEAIFYPKLTKPFSIPELVKILQREEEKRNKHKILAFGSKNDENDIYQFLEEENFYITLYDCEEAFCEHLKTDTYDLLIIDETCLDGKKWKLLNKIDKYAPHKSVILLTSREGKKNFVEAPELGIAVMDKTLFSKNRRQAIEFIKKKLPESTKPQVESDSSKLFFNNILDIQEKSDA